MDDVLIDKAFLFIAENEGFRANSYADGGRWSIGYGTISFEGETITQLEAKQRAIDHIKTQILLLIENKPFFIGLNENQKIVVIDYCYQFGVAHFLQSEFYLKIINGEFISWDSLKHSWRWNQFSYRGHRRIDLYNKEISTIANVSYFFGFLILVGMVLIYKFK